MRYRSCEWIESRLVLGPTDLKFCCVPHSDCTRGWVSICEYRGGPLPVAHILAERARLVERNNQGDPTSPCHGCRYLREDDWTPLPGNARFDWIGVDNFFRCNLRCIYCDLVIHEDWHLPDLAYAIEPVLRELIEGGLLAPGTTVVWGGGEPSILPGFEAIQRLLLDQDLTQQINTNAVRYADVITEGLARGRVEVVTSVDAGTPRTYERIKGGDCFDRVWANLARYARTGGDVYAKYIIRRDNLDRRDLAGFVRQCVEADVRKVVLSLDREEVAQHAISDETAFAFAWLDREARKHGREVSSVEKLIPTDAKRITKYVPLGVFPWRYWKSLARKRLESLTRTTARNSRKLLFARATRQAIHRANSFLDGEATQPDAVLALLDHQTRMPSTALGARLAELIQKVRDLPERQTIDRGVALPLSPDRWTVDGRPCYLVLDNRGADRPFEPVLWFGCLADPSALPLRVSLEDGARPEIQHTFHQAGSARIVLPAIPAGASAVYRVTTDRTWVPAGGTDPRRLGVSILSNDRYAALRRM
jgi:radical SAM family protein